MDHMDPCCTNLGPRGRLLRWVHCGSALGTAAALLYSWPGSPLVRTLAAVLVALSAFCGLQARSGTCALLAFAGERDLGRGREAVADHDERAVLRRTAVMIVLQSLAIASVSLAAALFI